MGMHTRQVVINREQAEKKWLGIPGVERTAGGRLWVAWYSGGPGEPHELNRVFVQHSDDDGASFSEPLMPVSHGEGSRLYDPTLWIDPVGHLWLIYNRGNAQTYEHDVQAVRCEQPDADRPEWSAPQRLGFDVPFAFRMNKPIVTRKGVWVLPVTWSRAKVEGWFQVGSEVQGVALSRDHGHTWELHGEVTAPPWALENMVIEKADGMLAMYVRTGGGKIWTATSEDEGETWSRGEPTDIVNPGSRFFIGELRSGAWLLLNSPLPDKRRSITARLSDDEGRTWTKPVVLDDREPVSYPDAVQAPGGTIYAVHDYDRRGAGEIVLSRFTEEDLR